MNNMKKSLISGIVVLGTLLVISSAGLVSLWQKLQVQTKIAQHQLQEANRYQQLASKEYVGYGAKPVEGELKHLSRMIEGTRYDLAVTNQGVQLLQNGQQDASADTKNLEQLLDAISNNHTSDFYFRSLPDGTIKVWTMQDFSVNGFVYAFQILSNERSSQAAQDEGNIPASHITAITAVQPMELFDMGVYSAVSLANSLIDGNTVILSANSGDGCGSVGVYWIVKPSKQPFKWVSHATGCAANNSGSLISAGIVNDKLYAGEVLINDESNMPKATKVLWQFDPVTRAKTLVATQAELPPGVAAYNWEQKPYALHTNEVLFMSDATTDSSAPEYFAFDVVTKTHRLLTPDDLMR